MKQIKYILILSILWTCQYLNAGTIDFNGSTIEIDGSFQQLAIHGTEISGKVTFTDLLDQSSLLSSISYKIEGPILKVTIKGNTHMHITIPNDVNILCQPATLIYEVSYYNEKKERHIHIQDTNGEVEINCDGYKVTLSRASGSASIVSYEDIHAILPNLSPNSIVSLDTYLGDILLEIPHTIDPKIKATAPKGSIKIKGNTSLFKGKNATGNQVLLHTENGDVVVTTTGDVSNVDTTELFQNEPNPFRGQTVVGFNLVEAAAATMTVYNVSGKVIFKQNIDGVKGYNTVNFSANQFGTSGVLYYTLDCGDFTATRKMIIIEK